MEYNVYHIHFRSFHILRVSDKRLLYCYRTCLLLYFASVEFHDLVYLLFRLCSIDFGDSFCGHFFTFLCFLH